MIATSPNTSESSSMEIDAGIDMPVIVAPLPSQSPPSPPKRKSSFTQFFKRHKVGHVDANSKLFIGIDPQPRCIAYCIKNLEGYIVGWNYVEPDKKIRSKNRTVDTARMAKKAVASIIPYLFGLPIETIYVGIEMQRGRQCSMVEQALASEFIDHPKYNTDVTVIAPITWRKAIGIGNSGSHSKNKKKALIWKAEDLKLRNVPKSVAHDMADAMMICEAVMLYKFVDIAMEE